MDREAVIRGMRKVAEKAKENLRKDGRLDPVLLIFSGGNMIGVVKLAFHDQETKRMEMTLAGMVADLQGADCVMLITEAWYKRVPIDDKILETGIRVKDMPGRVEAIIVNAKTRGGFLSTLSIPFTRKEKEYEFGGGGPLLERREAPPRVINPRADLPDPRAGERLDPLKGGRSEWRSGGSTPG